LTLEQNRDANLRYNPKNVSELSGFGKNVDLPKYLERSRSKYRQSHHRRTEVLPEYGSVPYAEKSSFIKRLSEIPLNQW
jgi:hypothetical protein